MRRGVPRRRSSTSGGPSGTIEIVEDVDREAFRAKAEPYLRENFTPEQVAVLDAIRSTAEVAATGPVPAVVRPRAPDPHSGANPPPA